jgi:hypothetical protein
MKDVLKLFGFLVVFYLFLSITIKNKPIFGHVYEITSPATKYAQSEIAYFFDRSILSTEKYSKRLFNNSVPKVRDSVDSKLASNLKSATSSAPKEDILESEKKELDQLIKNH